MKKLEEMSRDERSLLLYLETRAVDYSGKVDSAHMNDGDREIAKQWNDDGFIRYERICSRDAALRATTCVMLSDDAFNLAHQQRKLRAQTLWNGRKYMTTEEYRKAG
jgi:hypothetical protein